MDPAEVEAVSAALARVSEALAPPEESRWIAYEARALLNHYAVRSVGEKQEVRRLADWADTLRDLPEWAVRQAMADYRRSDAPYAPVPGEIRRRAERLCQDLRATHAKLKAVMDRHAEDGDRSGPLGAALRAEEALRAGREPDADCVELGYVAQTWTLTEAGRKALWAAQGRTRPVGVR
ncbi:hypothetical protein [Rhodothalassium salexigens]|uniref:hypothetical protein n=1 Tax=Rhodothalassium salexigens TaxID=1086 RepID=UPI00190880DA|nr:hypothetical protein [Rhodothalassium salexigens]MBK1638948.1 hypothetical protein [Rhodothalassium salexigens DSM 2132]